MIRSADPTETARPAPEAFRPLVRWALGAWAAGIAVVAGSPALAAGSEVVVKTTAGSVRGTQRAGYTQWLGIPYAAAPIGERRWRATQPATPWEGVRDADAPGDGCVQGTGWDPGYERPTLTEDCLFLNVYRPHGEDGAPPLPVFVWIHGGGLRGGAGYDVDPRKFVTGANVVFVTLNYRLGALGFLALPSLAEEDPDAVGNYGLLDQQAALRWVRDNIRAFGGDPARVTIAGQSAGARSVCQHLTSPSSQGLFAGAIHQSGSCDSASPATAQETGTRYAALLGCDDPATAAGCLRGKSAADILAAQEEVRISSTVSGGHDFPDPAEALRTGSFNRVPVMIGQTHDERTLSLFAARDFVGRPVTAAQYEEEVRARYGDDAAAVLERYPVDASWSPTVALATVEGDQRSCERRALYASLAEATPTYVYEFDEREPPPFVSIWRLNTTFRFGATHVNDLGYLFDYLHRALPFSSAQGELSDQMIRYWSAFVWTGDPNAEPLPAWPRYSVEEDAMLSLKAGATAVKTTFSAEHACDFWASVAR